MKETRLTTCGHNFCKECIEECLNRKHVCPCCNAPATINTLIVNKQMDRFIGIVDREKDKSAKIYFERLINPHAGSGSNGGENNGEQAEAPTNLSPIEVTFHKYMKKSLIGYQDYYKSLETSSLEKKEQLLLNIQRKC